MVNNIFDLFETQLMALITQTYLYLINKQIMEPERLEGRDTTSVRYDVQQMYGDY